MISPWQDKHVLGAWLRDLVWNLFEHTTARVSRGSASASKATLGCVFITNIAVTTPPLEQYIAIIKAVRLIESFSVLNSTGFYWTNNSHYRMAFRDYGSTKGLAGTKVLSRSGFVDYGGRAGTRTPDPLGVNEVL